MRIIRSITVTLVALLLLAPGGCGSEAERRVHAEALSRMDSAAALIEENPDSALSLLQAVDSAGLTDQPTQARFSLLMAQAIHKTSELTDMAIVQPAIDYYANHGSPTEQMLTDFYEGVVYKSHHQLTKALECYLRAEQRGEGSTFWEGMGRVITGQGTVYYNWKQWDSYLKCMLKALEYYRKSDDEPTYYRTLYFVAVAYARKGDYQNERKYLEMLRPAVNDPTSERQTWYYYELLLYYQNTNQKDSILALASIYEDVVKLDSYDSLDLVHCYIDANEPALARRYMPPADKNMTEYLMIRRWLSLNAMLCKAEGRYKEEAVFMERYDALQDSIRKIEDRSASQVAHEAHISTLSYSQQQTKTRKSNAVVMIAIGLIISLSIALVIYLRKHSINKKRIKADEEKYKDAERITAEKLKASERIAADRIDKLEDMLKETESLLSASLDKEKNVSNQLKEVEHQMGLKDEKINRLTCETEKLQSLHGIAFNQTRLCKTLIAAYGTKNKKLEEKQTAQLHKMFQTQNDFIKFAVHSLRSNTPNVYDWFVKQELSDTEIAICSLMRYGLTMKEIRELIPLIRNNNVTSLIRDKLGLTDTDPILRVILFSETMKDYINKKPKREGPIDNTDIGLHQDATQS